MPALSRLLSTRNFAPFFIVQLTGAYNDNVFRNALIALLTFRVVEVAGIGSSELIAASAGVFMVPFLLFSATGGTLADRLPRHLLIQYIKLAEVFLMALTWIGFMIDSIGLLFVILFLTGAQSALFGPIKYAILPNLLQPQELLAGNAWVAAGTFAAILIGTLCGTLLMAQDNAAFWVPGLLVLSAGFGYLMSRLIPEQSPAGASRSDPLNPLTATLAILRTGLAERRLAWLIFAISGFWMVGIGLLTQLPVFVRDTLHGTPVTLAICLTLFTLGVGIGALLCNLWLRNVPRPNLAPPAALTMAIGFFLLATTPPLEITASSGLLDSPQGLTLCGILLMLAMAGGFYAVPLYALLQRRAQNQQRARIIACNNILNAIFMVAASAAIFAIYHFGGTIETVFLSLGALCMAGAGILLLYTGGSLRRILLWPFARLQSLPEQPLPKDCLIFARRSNGWIAWALVAAIKGRLEIHTHAPLHRFYFLRPFVCLKTLDAVDQDMQWPTPDRRSRAALILTGVRDEPLMLKLMRRARAQTACPIAVAGVTDPRRHHPGFRPRIRVALELCDFSSERDDEDVAQAAQRDAYQIYDRMCALEYQVQPPAKSSLQSLHEAAGRYGRKHLILSDTDRHLNYRDLLRAIYAIAPLLNRAIPKQQDTVGLLLPNVIAAPITFFATHACQRIPVMLNYSAGFANVSSACCTAQLTHIVSSRQFVEKAGLEKLVMNLEVDQTLIYLEDLMAQLHLGHKLWALWRALRPPPAADPDQTAVVLFTSGSEGEPKGVVLSHRNLHSNRSQVQSVLDFTPQDQLLLCLPLYHSFALGVGMMLPLCAGIHCLLYPNPLHYKQIPDLIQAANITVFFSTDTFLNGYAQHATPEKFQLLRLLIAGAEPLKPSTRELWKQRFGVQVYEGYGVTETSPAVSVNSPPCHRHGSVGRLMPEIDARLIPLEGDENPDRGRLLLRGPNVMRGYWMPGSSRTLTPPADGWHDTGDIAEFDAYRFLYLRGRAKRFAKIGGEMVSLAQIEQKVSEVWPDYRHIVCAVRHPKRGEALVLITEHPSPDAAELHAQLGAMGLPNIAYPRHLLTVDTLPVLGSGKPDLRRAQETADSVLY